MYSNQYSLFEISAPSDNAHTVGSYIKSPIIYTGNKYDLLKYIVPQFPTNVRTFYDVFGGGGTVSLNAPGNHVVCNDYIPYIMQLLNSWEDKDIEPYIKYLESIDVHNREQFVDARNKYNQTHDLDLLFILISNSFNGQMRFNSAGQYNSSYANGLRYFNDNIKNNIRLTIPIIQSGRIDFTVSDFRDISYESASDRDFFYFDPPYSLSCGVYQDGKRGFKGWGRQDDLDLLSICDKLNSAGIRFAMSNLLSSKGNTNELLSTWSAKYNVVHIKANYNIGARKALSFVDDEVLVKNY